MTFPTGTPQLTLWVGTKGGSLGVFIITRAEDSVKMQTGECYVAGWMITKSVFL